jgi:hypothetical protein
MALELIVPRPFASGHYSHKVSRVAEKRNLQPLHFPAQYESNPALIAAAFVAQMIRFKGILAPSHWLAAAQA